MWVDARGVSREQLVRDLAVGDWPTVTGEFSRIEFEAKTITVVGIKALFRYRCKTVKVMNWPYVSSVSADKKPGVEHVGRGKREAE